MCFFFHIVSTNPNLSKEEEKKQRSEKLEKSKESVMKVGHKFSQMGGPQVVAAYFGLLIFIIYLIYREFLCIGGFYAAFKAGLVSPDAIVGFLNRWEFTSKFSHIIANNPNVYLLEGVKL